MFLLLLLCFLLVEEDSVRLLTEDITSCFDGVIDVDSSYSPNSPVDSYGTVSLTSWETSATTTRLILRRKESTRDRKAKYAFRAHQTRRFDQLVKMCGQKLGPDSTIEILTRFGRSTGVKDCTSLLQVCVEKARKTDDEEVSLHQIFKAYKILEFMKERGYQIEEKSYGVVLSYLIDFGLVQEFHLFSDLIRDASLGPSLAYYEMLLWIRAEDDEKIQDLCYNLALYDGDDKSSFQQNFLLAFCDGDRKKELLPLLETFDIMEVSSMDDASKVFKSLGKLSLDSVAERFLLTFKVNDIKMDDISRFIFDFVVSNADLAVEDVISKFKTLHATLEMVPASKYYEKLIRYCCETFEVHWGLDVVDEMFKVGLLLSLETFHYLYAVCEDKKEYHLVHRIYSTMSSHGLEPDVETFRRMINLCVRMRDFEGAYAMVADMQRLNLVPNVSIYNAIMAGFFREKNIKGALTVLKQMQGANVQPDSHTYSYLLTNCTCEEDILVIRGQMEQSDVTFTKHVYMAMINAYAACGQFEKAKEVISVLVEENKQIKLLNLNEIKSVLVSALASNGQMSDALDVFTEIKQAGCVLEPKAAICLMEHLDTEGELTRLLEILEELKELLHFWVDGCIRVILYCVRRHKHLKTAIDLLEQVVEKGKMEADVGGSVFDRVFCEFAETEPREMQFGMDLLQAVKMKFNTRLSRKSLDFLLSACISANDLRSCFLIWKEYKEAGLPYNVLSYVRMYQVLLALGDNKSAEGILNKIPTDDYHVNLVIQASQAKYIKADSPDEKKNKKKKKKKKNKVVG
ncbi:OLC1v1022839C3 [Oldenlandia corymbosa var. corymbosa]|uniref:OLC1v1022839C3 n=1 Tax=Oldenlandia corymbosa var. corymbosa TaxID=529605 RepID=A0AAV1C2D6_OLDCO|nr:OLC1v1022839C3 [Oldenlandia corymbosa var. corymbosa]